MDLFLAICQGLGLALAAGLGGLLVPLLAAVLAHIDVGWSLDGTDWEWVASEWFIAVLFAMNVLAYLARRRRDILEPATLIAVVALGAVLFAASLAEEGTTAWPGLVAGGLAAAFAAFVARDVLAGAARRESQGAGQDNLVLLAAIAGMLLALVSLFLPPVSIVALVTLLALAVSRRGRADRKYAGLRILR